MSEVNEPNERGKRAVTSVAQRSKAWEKRSINSDEELLEGARARWRSLPAGRQMDLARCLATCRRADLTRSYRQVVSVAAGLRRRNSEDGVEYLHNEVCLVIVVRRKLSPTQLAKSPNQTLPTDVLTPACIDGRDEVVAVPTDVQPQSRMLRATSQSLTGAHSEHPDGRWARGAMTWAVSIGGKKYAIAPIHVLSPRPALDGIGRRAGAEVSLQGAHDSPAGAAMLQSLIFGGRVVPGSEPSFDAQLAKILRPAEFSALFGGLRISSTRPWIRDESELNGLLAQGRSLEIVPPFNNDDLPKDSMLPLQAVRTIAEHEMPLRYDFAGGSHQHINHSVLELQVRFGERTYSGDSGSPVLLRDENDELSLVGMHIAGDTASGTSYIIPIWRLINPASYTAVGGVIPQGIIELVTAP